MVGFVFSIEEHAAADTVFGSGRHGACNYMCMRRKPPGRGPEKCTYLMRELQVGKDKSMSASFVIYNVTK